MQATETENKAPAAAPVPEKPPVPQAALDKGGPDQPTSATMEAAAQAAGLQYAWLPVQPAVQTPEEIARFAALLAELPKPILAFCRSGARSGKLYRAATGG